jgi:hypothetical protein
MHVYHTTSQTGTRRRLTGVSALAAELADARRTISARIRAELAGLDATSDADHRRIVELKRNRDRAWSCYVEQLEFEHGRDAIAEALNRAGFESTASTRTKVTHIELWHSPQPRAV